MRNQSPSIVTLVNSGSIGPIIANVSDPYHSSQDLHATDDSGDGLIPLDVLVSRFAAKATFTAGNVTCYQVDSLDFASKATGHVWTGYKYAQNNSQAVAIPSECALWVRFPGSAGIIQCKGSSPGTRSLILDTGAPNNHGAIYVDGLWVMGDPTLTAGTADSFEFLEIANAFEAHIWDCRILGYLGASRVIDVSGVTQFKARGLHYSNCGVLAGTTSSMLYINGNEFGVIVENVIFNAVSPPANVPAPADKVTNACYGIYRDVTGNISAAGDVWINIQGADPMLALMNIAPTSGFVGSQTLIDINPSANVASAGAGGTPAVIIDGTNGAIRGGVVVIGGETHLNGTGGSAFQFKNLTCPVTVHNHRVDQLGQTFNFDFTGTTGPVYLDECTTDTGGQRVPIANATTGLVKEKFGNVWGHWYVNSGGVTANLAVGWTGTRQVQTLPTSSDPQAVAGVAATTVGTGLLSPIQDPGQANVTITADATAGGIAVGALFSPSTTTAGEFKQVAAGTRASGTSQQAISASGTGLAQLS